MVSLVGAKDRVFWYLSDLTSRVVAETGIPSDMYHLGKVILRSLKDAPDFVLQIDAATGKSETFQSVLERSVRCALSLKKMGFKCGDVLAVIAPYYLELAVLYYAALYLGIKIAVMDPVLDDSGVKEMLQVYRANIIFSQNSKIPIVKEAMNQIDLIAKLVSFEDEDGSDVISFAKFIEKCGDVDVYAFKPTDFDPAVTTATIMPSSGTTGAPKVVDSTHKNYLSSIPYYWANVGSKLPTPFETHFRTTSVQGVTSIIAQVCAPIIRFTNIQTSAGYSVENHIDVINEYRPQTMVLSPIEILSIIKPVMKKKADLTCFKTILVGGSPVPQKLFRELKKIAPKVALLEGFGATEISGFIFWRPAFSKSFGRPMGCYDVRIFVVNVKSGRFTSTHGLPNTITPTKHHVLLLKLEEHYDRLVDPETLKDITEPHVTGELWVKGHGVAKGYYNNPIDTKAAFLPDGWFRTGDLFYRDEQFSFYYVDRLKLLLKYKTFHVSTVDIENVILEYPGVLDVVVVGIPDWECGDLPAACIVPHPDNPPTAQGVKDFVKDKLSDAKQLRGGVLFMEEFPLTVNLKVDRIKLKEIALTAKRE